VQVQEENPPTPEPPLDPANEEDPWDADCGAAQAASSSTPPDRELVDQEDEYAWGNELD
jgi:hypothetical protein